MADRLNTTSASAGDKRRRAFSVARIRDVATMRNGPPFIPAHDITRGILHAVQATLHFALMLIVMYVSLCIIVDIFELTNRILAGPFKSRSSSLSSSALVLERPCSGGSRVTLLITSAGGERSVML